MVKIAVAKSKDNRTKLSTKVRKEGSLVKVKKVACKGHHKRLLMFRRRYEALVDEKKSWETKNRELIDNFNTEKKINAELQKDVFTWQRLYHEAIIAQNTYKVKHAEMVQCLSSCLKEIKTAYPHIVGLSDTLCRNQIRLTDSLNAISTFVAENHFPQAFGDCIQANLDVSKKSEKRTRHKVGPMVNGVLIQKPTIRLERVMLQQPQDQEPTNNNHSPERGHALTPIVEENDEETNLHLDEITMRRRRKNRLGTGERWRMRKQQEKLEKERQMERERERENQRCSESESSDTDDRLDPVIQLQRLSGLLLGPDHLEIDRRASEGKGTSSRPKEPENRRVRSGEDPMEGCSWMHLNTAHPKKKSSEKRKAESSASSDSSDEESFSVNVVAMGNVRSSLSDSLAEHNSYSKSRKTSSCSSSAATSHDASDSFRVEPDSTNNIEDLVFNRASGSDSLMIAVPPNVTVRVNDSLDQGVSNRTAGNTIITPVARADSLRSLDQRRSSKSSNYDPVTSPIMEGKRIRKPKIHLYPGEEPGNSAGSTDLVRKKKKVSPPSSSSNVVLHQRSSVGGKSFGRRSKTNCAAAALTPDIVDQRSSQGRKSGSLQKSQITQRKNKSSVKNSSVDRLTSSISQRLSQNQDDSEGRQSRRLKGPVSYKEPKMNTKLRRPK